jgi:dihydroflavonol-4-reductase
MKTLITGATGFVGSAVLRRLLAAGHEVRALVRAGSDRRNLEGLDVEIATGDLCDPASLRQAVAGCDTLFHVAADYRLWIPDPDSIYRTNVEGTRMLIRAALEAGVSRVVYTSSVATLGLNPDRTPADEATPVTLADMVGHYKRSKFLAEAAVRELVESEGAPVVIVNPSTPVGPRDIKPTPTGRIIVDMLRRRIPAYVETGLNIVHVDDVAEGHLLALERGRIGTRYVLGGENLTLKEILCTVAEIGNVPPPRVALHHAMVLPVAWVAERVASVTGREPFATVDAVRMAKKFMFFSSERATAELGYHSRPAREGLAEAVDWFRQNRYC